MRLQTLSKSFAMVISASVAIFVLLGLSVSEPMADTSAKGDSSSLQEIQKPAPRRLTLKPVAKKQAKKTTARPYLALLNSAPVKDSTLLAVVQQPDITPRHQELSDAVLRALPSPCRTYLKNYFVRYKDATQRGLGGKTTIILDGTPPDAEFAGLLIHECGHVTHSNMMGTATAGVSAFKDSSEPFYSDSPMVEFFAINWMTETVLKRAATKADFASGYGQSDAFEDFAESFAMYILHRPAMRERAKTNTAMAAKLAWMEKYLPVSETAIGTDTYTWNKVVPWDVTKLPYELTLAK